MHIPSAGRYPGMPSASRPPGACCSPACAANCTANGARCPTACRACGTIRSARARNTSDSGEADPGLHARLNFDPDDDVAAPLIRGGARPAIAVLREQGVNSQTEMAAAFTRAGFDAYDVHMTDILEARVRLERFHGLVVCGGFSYGDVLGAGEGWAKSILFNHRARDEFAAYFARPQTFTLGVCNGCQMLAALKELVPGADAWPRFVRNRSEQYEARLDPGAHPRVAFGAARGHAGFGPAGGGGARRGPR